MDQVAAKTGLSRRVIAAWALAEQSGGAAKSYRAKGYNNWLNIGAFDSGFGDIYHDPTWRSPDKAAAATADFLKGRRFGASGGIRKILDAAGQDPGAQISAIARSGWASSGYEGGSALRTLYGQLGWMKDSKQGGAAPAPGSTGGGSSGAPAATAAPGSTGGDNGLAALTAVLAARQRPTLQTAGVQAPSFSARPAMPQGYQAPSSSGGAAQEKPQSIGEILAAAGYGSAGSEPVTATAAPVAASGGAAAPRAASPSRGLVPAAQWVDKLAGRFDLPITAKQEQGHQSGGDHDPAVRGATARDIGGSDATRKRMFQEVTRALGVKDAVFKGPDINVVRGGVRYQIISRDHGSGPHLHIGMRLAK